MKTQSLSSFVAPADADEAPIGAGKGAAHKGGAGATPFAHMLSASSDVLVAAQDRAATHQAAEAGKKAASSLLSPAGPAKAAVATTGSEAIPGGRAAPDPRVQGHAMAGTMADDARGGSLGEHAATAARSAASAHRRDAVAEPAGGAPRAERAATAATEAGKHDEGSARVTIARGRADTAGAQGDVAAKGSPPHGQGRVQSGQAEPTFADGKVHPAETHATTAPDLAAAATARALAAAAATGAEPAPEAGGANLHSALTPGGLAPNQASSARGPNGASAPMKASIPAPGAGSTASPTTSAKGPPASASGAMATTAPGAAMTATAKGAEALASAGTANPSPDAPASARLANRQGAVPPAATGGAKPAAPGATLPTSTPTPGGAPRPGEGGAREHLPGVAPRTPQSHGPVPARPPIAAAATNQPSNHDESEGIAVVTANAKAIDAAAATARSQAAKAETAAQTATGPVRAPKRDSKLGTFGERGHDLGLGEDAGSSRLDRKKDAAHPDHQVHGKADPTAPVNPLAVPVPPAAQAPGHLPPRDDGDAGAIAALAARALDGEGGAEGATPAQKAGDRAHPGALGVPAFEPPLPSPALPVPVREDAAPAPTSVRADLHPPTPAELGQLPEDEGLRLAIMSKAAHLSIEDDNGRSLELHVRLLPEGADIRASGALAPMVQAKANELGIALAAQGVTLGRFELGQGDRRGGRGAPEGAEDQGGDRQDRRRVGQVGAATPGTSTARASDGRIHVKA